LFSQEVPSNNLGFVDSKADAIEVEIAGSDYVIRQSPTLLNSRRAEGTTGAVLWKVTPLIAAWLGSKPAILADFLHSNAVIVELGCGVSGLIGLVLCRSVKRYVLTDQEYVMKYLRANIAANSTTIEVSTSGSNRKGGEKGETKGDNLTALALDWENDSAEILKTVIPENSSIDVVLVCDCVYNEYLIDPLVQTCVDVCRLVASAAATTVVLVAQQLRSDTVTEQFLEALMKEFDVWRVPNEAISTNLGSKSGYVVHLAILRDPRNKAG
jgi:predicted nicotinamide N-methyase